MNMYILTMVFLISINTHSSMTSVTQVYMSKQQCEDALVINRESLATGKVVLATCTKR